MMIPVADPFRLELSPGKKVQDLTSREDCQRAIFSLDMEMESIAAQIAKAEANPAAVVLGWRTKAQSAIRWKKRTRTAVMDFAKRFEPIPVPTGTKRRLIINVIKDELGPEEFERLIDIAKARYPHAFRETSGV
ncbi:MAG: hypothetical protein ACOH2N_15005 [Devosia sp.]